MAMFDGLSNIVGLVDAGAFRAQVLAAQAGADIGTPVDPSTPPYTGIVTVYDQIGSEYFQGTGILLTPTEVLTASHVLWTQGVGAAIHVYVTAQDETPYGGSFGGFTSYAQNVHYNAIDDANDMLSLDASQNDYAVIHLSTPLYQSTNFGLLSSFEAGYATLAGYPGSFNGQLVTDTGPVAVYPGISVFNSDALGPGSSGGPVLVTGPDGQQYSAGVISSYDVNDPHSGNDAQITNAAFTQIEGWLASDGVHQTIVAEDTSTSQDFSPQATPYSGPVAGLADQYVNLTADNLNLTGYGPNQFLHSGSGEDAIQVTSGNNVLDGGTGSNFLVGGTGHDTFFTDDRAATSDIWDTLVNFHAGDAATLFGVTQAGFSFDWENGQGAGGYTGLTLHVTAPGKPDASLTLSGYTSAALTNGQLSISFGTTGGSPYMYIHGNG